jgi:ferredoxin hydrogenase large subunit
LISAGKTYREGEIAGVLAIDEKACKGCDSCKRFCPTGAIDGMFGSVHSIDVDKCINCGQCLLNCPFGAPYELSMDVDRVISMLKDDTVTVAGIIAPAVRVAIGEEFGLPEGSLVTRQMYGAMRKVGFEILDNNYAADLTIMEEGSEFIARARYALFKEKGEGGKIPGPLPQFTSCCPAWVRFVELYYPTLLPNVSSAKSPMQMAGALAKTYGALNVWETKPKNLFSVGIMPCTAKKFEATRPEFFNAYHYLDHKGLSGSDDPYPDVDAVLTTRDLATLLKKLGVDLASEQETDGGNILADYTGAATIFGNSGGVMEAALRTAHRVLTGKEMEPLELDRVRGLKGVKEASITLTDTKYNTEITVNVAVVNGLRKGIDSLLDDVVQGRSPYHFIEVMACPGGCINGGGQPIAKTGTSWLENAAPWLAWK